jgi:FkbM family methyltransferase
MIVTKDYLFSRLQVLLETEIRKIRKVNVQDRALYEKKLRIPLFLRKVLFSYLNPVYAIWKVKHSTAQHNHSITQKIYSTDYLFAYDLFAYILRQDAKINIGDFYPNTDESTVRNFLDNRIKTFINAMPEEMTFEEQVSKKEALEAQRKVRKEKKGIFSFSTQNKKYLLPRNEFSHYIFDMDYGLNELPYQCIKNLEGKDFLDIGTYIGDTAIMFLKYKPNSVLSYEPVDINYKDLLKTIELNKAQDLIVPIKKGLGEKQDVLRISKSSSSASMLGIDANDENTLQVDVSTIDIECKNRQIGLIKMDVEGFEYYVVKGGLETIKRDKPVMFISLYHTGKDFFEIPPMLKNAVPEYKFRFIDLKPHDVVGEKILIAYV